MSAKYRCDGWLQYEWRSPEAFLQHPSGVSGCYWHLVSHWLGKICSGDCPECDQSISYPHQPFITQPSGKLKCGSHSNCHPSPPHSLGGLEMFGSVDVLSPSTAGWDLCCCWGVFCCCSLAVPKWDAEFSKAWERHDFVIHCCWMTKGGIYCFILIIIIIILFPLHYFSI